jgi:hypothetical protein
VRAIRLCRYFGTKGNHQKLNDLQILDLSECSARNISLHGKLKA